MMLVLDLKIISKKVDSSKLELYISLERSVRGLNLNRSEIYNPVPPAADSEGVFKKVYPGRLKLNVEKLESLVSDIPMTLKSC